MKLYNKLLKKFFLFGIFYFIKKKVCYKYFVILALLFLIHIFFRVYQLEERAIFSWDQVDNAWAAKGILIDHKFPLVGMVAKQNTGFYVGPAYYYLISLVYWGTHLDPIASPVFAAITSIFTFFVIFFITKKVFSLRVAYMAVFIHAISFFISESERFQWPVNLMVPLAFIIFYSLYNISTGREKYIFLLALALGFSVHLNFTSTFFFIVALLTIPFFPKNKKMLKYSLLSLPIFVIWLIPNFISEFNNAASSSKNIFSYVGTYYHGFHLTRFIQVAKDAFIENEAIISFKYLKFLKYLLYPIFVFAFLFRNKERAKFIIIYLVGIWFLVPWVVFSVYRGEISNYYFSLTRPFVLIMLSYILLWIYSFRTPITKVLVLILLFYYTLINVNNFFHARYQGLFYHREKTLEAIKNNKKIDFAPGDPESYLFYVYTKNRNE